MRSLSERLRSFEQQKARLAEAEAKLKVAEKKARSRRLIETGILIERAGLQSLESDALYGALLSLHDAAESAKQVEQWAIAGRRAIAQEKERANAEPIVLTFPSAPDASAAALLRSSGFRFNRMLRHWEGMSEFDEAEKLAVAHGGQARRISYYAERPIGREGDS